jgi:hypothetical protein
MVADFCPSCGAPNEETQAVNAVLDSVVAKYRSEAAAVSAVVPPEVEAQFASCGATVEPVEPGGGMYLVRLRDLPIARLSAKGVEFVDVEVGRTWMGLVHYSKVALFMEKEHGGSGKRRTEIRQEQLGLELILGQAAKAGFVVREQGGMWNRAYYLSHPDFGEVARLLVVRGTSEVAAVAFASQSQFALFSTLNEIAGALKAGQAPS